MKGETRSCGAEGQKLFPRSKWQSGCLAAGSLVNSAPDQLQTIERSQNIEGWNVRIYFASRNPWVLMAVAAAIVVIAVGVAFFVQKPMEKWLPQLAPTPDDLRAELEKAQPGMARVFDLLPTAAWDPEAETLVPRWIADSKLSKTEQMVASAAWSSIQAEDSFEPSADLLYYAHCVKPLRYANELIGDHFAAAGEKQQQAAAYYRRELAHFPEAKEAWQKLVGLAAETHDRSLLKELAANPAFARRLPVEQRIYLAALQGRWLDVIRPMGEFQVRMLTPVPVALAIISGLAWFLIALQSIQPPRFASARVVMPVVAVALGMASTFPTILSGLWMEEALGVAEGETPLSAFIYFMASVGPREELIKLAFVLPLIPIFAARASRLEMLVCAGCVGLGFAIWENLQYFAQHGAAAAFPRFLTANFFHLALTGVNGLALYDLFHDRRKFVPFLLTLLGTVVAHGASDFFASIPGLPALALASMMTFMLVSLFFFRSLRSLRDASTDQLSIGATFVVGVSTLVGAIIIFAARDMGLPLALVTMAITASGMMMVGYMFYWQLGSGMSVASEETSPAPYRYS